MTSSYRDSYVCFRYGVSKNTLRRKIFADGTFTRSVFDENPEQKPMKGLSELDPLVENPRMSDYFTILICQISRFYMLIGFINNNQ